MPKVSVIVPFYNVEKHIRKCLDSLVSQTLKEFEILLVDDGSKDGSTQVAQEFVKKYPEIFIYLKKENGGLSDARNFAISYAKGEYIAFLDSDDYVEKNTYEQMYELAKKENSDLVECDFYWEYPNKRKEDIGEIYKGKKEMLQKIRVVAWNKLIKKEILDKSKIIFPKGLYYEDVEFTYKLIPYINTVSFLKKPCIHYIQRENSISNSQTKKNKDIFKVLDNVIEYYKKQDIYKDYETILEYIYTRYTFCSSFLRIVKIQDKEARKKMLEDSWKTINNKYPNWRKNEILKKQKNKKNIYMRTINKRTYIIYSKILKGLV